MQSAYAQGENRKGQVYNSRELAIGLSIEIAIVFCMLDQIKRTSAGLYNLPHWYLQLSAPSLSLPLSHLFNLSLLQSIIPTQMKIQQG